jgi:hypothetical protein
LKIGGDNMPECFVIYIKLFSRQITGAFIFSAVAVKSAALAPAVSIVVNTINEFFCVLIQAGTS